MDPTIHLFLERSGFDSSNSAAETHECNLDGEDISGGTGLVKPHASIPGHDGVSLRLTILKDAPE